MTTSVSIDYVGTRSPSLEKGRSQVSVSGLRLLPFSLCPLCSGSGGVGVM